MGFPEEARGRKLDLGVPSKKEKGLKMERLVGKKGEELWRVTSWQKVAVGAYSRVAYSNLS